MSNITTITMPLSEYEKLQQAALEYKSMYEKTFEDKYGEPPLGTLQMWQDLRNELTLCKTTIEMKDSFIKQLNNTIMQYSIANVALHERIADLKTEIEKRGNRTFFQRLFNTN